MFKVTLWICNSAWSSTASMRRYYTGYMDWRWTVFNRNHWGALLSWSSVWLQLGQKSSTASLIKRLISEEIILSVDHSINWCVSFSNECYQLYRRNESFDKFLIKSIRSSIASTMHFCCMKQHSSLIWTSFRKAGIVASASESSITTRHGSVNLHRENFN